jgi:hypothetical protein
MKNWIIGRLKEPSTYAGLFAIGSAFFSLDLTPDQQAAVVMLATGLFVSKG